jgi:hypothetical protein
MVGMPKAIRSLCVAYDLQAYSGHGMRRKLAAQEQLSDLLRYAFGEARLAEASYQMQEQGDGGVALLPTGEGMDEPRMLVTLIRAFEIGLAENNEQLLEDRRLRLRLALNQGVVVPDARTAMRAGRSITCAVSGIQPKSGRRSPGRQGT